MITKRENQLPLGTNQNNSLCADWTGKRDGSVGRPATHHSFLPAFYDGATSSDFSHNHARLSFGEGQHILEANGESFRLKEAKQRKKKSGDSSG